MAELAATYSYRTSAVNSIRCRRHCHKDIDDAVMKAGVHAQSYVFRQNVASVDPPPCLLSRGAARLAIDITNVIAAILD